METKKAIHVVLASPSDVAEERSAFEDAIKMANQVVSSLAVVFIPRRWEEVSPGYHPEGPQALIDSRLNIEQCDLLVGVFWKRFGVVDTPPYSRTAREILRALAARKVNLTRPDVKVYFCNRRYAASVKELEEHTLVLKFKEELADTVKYEEYDDADEFRALLLRDLIEHLVRLTGIHEPSDPQLALHVVSEPRLLRLEGLTELTPDLRLSVTGTVPFSWVGDVVYFDINVFPQSFVGNRTTEDGLSDVVLTEGSEDGALLARARIGERYSNAISFSGVGITAKDSTLHQDLWIRGIRCRTMHLAGQRLLTEVAVTVTRRGQGGGYTSILGPHSVILGFPIRSTQFSVQRASDEVRWSAKDEGPQVISAFTVHFREAFPGAFKSREEESGQSQETAAHGDILRVYSQYIPKHFDIFVTARDLPSPYSWSPVEIGKAIAVQIDSSGRLLNRDCAASRLVWKSNWVHLKSQIERVQMNTQIPLIRIDRAAHGVNLVDYFIAGWELLNNASIHQERELVFGVVLAGEGNWPPREISLCGSLAPEGSLLSPRGSHPVPRFCGTYDYVTLTLDTTDDVFDPLRAERQKYIDALKSDNPQLLAKGIDRDNFEAFLLWRFPGHRLEANEKQIDEILVRLKISKYRTLGDLDAAIVPWYPRLAEFILRFENYFKMSADSYPNPSKTAASFDSASVRFATLLSIVDIDFRSKSFGADWTENLVKPFTDMLPIRQE